MIVLIVLRLSQADPIQNHPADHFVMVIIAHLLLPPDKPQPSPDRPAGDIDQLL